MVEINGKNSDNIYAERHDSELLFIGSHEEEIAFVINKEQAEELIEALNNFISGAPIGE